MVRLKMRSFFDGRDFQIRWDLLPDSKEEKFIEWLLGPAFLSATNMDNEHFLERVFSGYPPAYNHSPESLARLYDRVYEWVCKNYSTWKRRCNERIEIERSIGE
jgi:hypothetical protein